MIAHEAAWRMTTELLPPDYFAGRYALYARLRQFMLTPAPHALTFTGRAGMGKSAFLQHVPAVLEPTLIGVYLPLAQLRLDHEALWWREVVNETNAALALYEFDPHRLPVFPSGSAGDELRAWISSTYLSEIMHIIRPQRRLAWLCDDVREWLHAMQTQQLPTDLPLFLGQVMQQYPQLSIVLTADTDYEHQLQALAPLYHPAAVQRIGRLQPAESQQLLQQAAPGLSDKDAQRVHQAAGGDPRLLQRYARELAQLSQHDLAERSLQDVTPRIYAASVEEFRTLWRTLNRDERLVLTALSTLLYGAAARTLKSEALAAWLQTTDFPMDIIAVNAALRGLEYAEIVASSPQGVGLVTGLLQEWLLQNARLETVRVTPRLSPHQMLLAGFVVLVIVVLVLALLTFAAPLPPNVPMPTVTLG
jgi:hypothetical protein